MPAGNTVLSVVIPNEQRKPMMDDLNTYLAQAPTTESFHLNYLKEMLATGPAALDRPYDENKLDSQEYNTLRNTKMTAALSSFNNTSTAKDSTSWNYSAEKLNEIKDSLLSLSELQTLQQQLDNFFKWAETNNKKYSSEQVASIKELMTKGFLFNLQAGYFKANPNNVERNNWIAQNNALKRVALFISSKDIAQDVVKDTISNSKGIASLLQGDAVKYASGELKVLEGHNITTLLGDAVTKIKTNKDFVMMPEQVQSKILEDFRKDLTTHATLSTNLKSGQRKTVLAAIESVLPAPKQAVVENKKSISSFARIAQGISQNALKAKETLKKISANNKPSVDLPESEPEPAPKDLGRARSSVNPLQPPKPTFDTTQKVGRHQITEKEVKESHKFRNK